MSASILNKGRVRGDFARGVELSVNNLKLNDLRILGSTESNLATFGFLEAPGAPVRRSGPSGITRAVGHKIEIINERWNVNEGVKWQDWKNDETSITRGIPGEIGKRFGNLQFKLVTDLIKLGTTGIGYDGAAFFSATHYGTQTNNLTATEVPALNVTTANAPTPEEVADCVTGVIGYMMGANDQRGEPMNENARDFTVICPAASLWSPFITATKSNNLASGQTSIVAALNEGDFNIDVISTPRLTDDDVFYVFRGGETRTKAFLISENLPVNMSILDESSDHFQLEQEFVFSGNWYGGAGFGEPMYATRNQLS